MLNNNRKRCMEENNIKCKKQKVNREQIYCEVYLNYGKITRYFEVYLERKYFIKNDLYAIYNVISDLFPTNNWSDMIVEKIKYIGDKNIMYITVI